MTENTKNTENTEEEVNVTEDSMYDDEYSNDLSSYFRAYE